MMRSDVRNLLVLGLAAAALGGCSDDEVPFSQRIVLDGGVDFALAPQVTHLGVAAPTCCLVANADNAQALYLANPKPGNVDQLGHEHPSRGELHIVSPFGGDYVLAQNVPAFGYGFSPDGHMVLYTAPTTGDRYSLSEALLSSPELTQPDTVQVIADGLDDSKLTDQSFFTPSGQYLIVGARAPNFVNSADLHVVDVHARKDAYQLGKGAFSYLELVTGTDTMVFENSTASTTPGTPSVQGIYILQLAAASKSGLHPTLLDTHTGPASLSADGQTLFYLRQSGDLMMLDLRTNDFVTVASGVLSFSLGNARKGPIVYVKQDLSLHVRPKLRPEILATPPAAIDIFSPVLFSPDGQHIYFFQHVNSQNNHGDMYHVLLPPVGSGTPSLVATRVALNGLSFTSDRLLYLRELDSTGSAGQLVSAALDGSDEFIIADGAATGQVQVAYPQPPLPAFHGPRYDIDSYDLAVPPPPPVLANLTGASLNTSITPIDGSKAVVGALAYGPAIRSTEAVLNSMVHSSAFAFSDDGYALLYAADAAYNSTARNYTGNLMLFETVLDINPSIPMLTGVSELGPIVSRTLYVNAPVAPTPGIYLVKF
jgi:hypothetical protein